MRTEYARRQQRRQHLFLQPLVNDTLDNITRVSRPPVRLHYLTSILYATFGRHIIRTEGLSYK